MDMSHYSGAAFLKVGDVKVNGPLRVVIDDIQLGKYGKPDVSFTRRHANCRSTRPTTRPYAMRMARRADGWIGKEIELSLGEIEFQGEPQESILVKPISPPIEKKPPRRKPGGDMKDDSILICDVVSREAGPNRLPGIFAVVKSCTTTSANTTPRPPMSTLAIALSPSMKFGAALS